MALAQIARHAGVSTVAATDVTDVRSIAILNAQFSPKNLITVSATGGQFHDVQTALDSISGSSLTNQFVVLVGPGTYVSATPITLSNPYVTLIGYDPGETMIRVYEATGNFQAFTIAANNVTISNLGLDLGTGSAGSNSVVGISANVQSATISNCLIGQRSFAESVVNNVQGVVVGTGATLTIRHSSIWAENYGYGLSNLTGTGTVVASDLAITTLNIDAISNGGSLTISSSTISTGNKALSNTGQVTANDTTFGSMVYLTGGASAFSDSVFTGVEASGSSTSATFSGCSTIGGSNGTSVVGFAVRSSASCSISSCTNTGNNAVTADGSNPIVANCSFNAVGATDIIDVINGANPIIANSMFYIENNAAASAINILDTVSNPTVTGNCFQGPFSGSLPSNFVNGVPGSKLMYGQNTSSQGVTLFSSTVTASNLNSSGIGYVTYVALSSVAAGQGAALVGIQPITGVTSTNVQGALQTVSGVATSVQAEVVGARGAAADLNTRLSASMNTSGYILQTGIDPLRPYASAPADAEVHISVGTYTKSDGSKKLTPSTVAVVLSSVVSPSNSRIDVMYVDDSGNLLVKIGTEAPAPTVPTYPQPGLVIAEVTCTYNAGNPPIIDSTKIKDVRALLRSYSSAPPAGTVAHTIVPAASVPTLCPGWLVRDGTVYYIADYPVLGAILGPLNATFKGNPTDPHYPANGTTTFAVPDDRGLTDIGAGLGTETISNGLTTKTLYGAYGEEIHTLTVAEMPVHHHTATATAYSFGNGPGPSTGSAAADTGDTGGGTSHNTIQPSRAYTPIIKT